MAFDFDVAITERTALQAGTTYFLPENTTERTQFGGNADDAWNIFVGFVYRPMRRN